MKKRISNQFMINYLIVFFLSILAAIFALLLMSFATDIISKTLVKNIYPAESIMQDDYTKINATSVVENGGGVQIINERYEVIYTAGLNTLETKQFTTGQFTEFLMKSKSKGISYHYDILYNSEGKFWLIVTFPTSLRLDLALVFNKEAVSKDINNVAGALIAVILFYLLILSIFAFIFSKITSVRITKPLRKLCESTKQLREGNYSARVDLNLKNEFAELQDTFNEMAEKIDTEISLRKQSEDNRKKLIVDISHDLKNPLASVVGYSELCLKNSEALSKEQVNYMQIINKNSQRVSRMLGELFELSKLDSPEFVLKLCKMDLCEFIRQTCAELIPALEQAGLEYDFNLPQEPIYTMIDTVQISRVFYNLAENAIRYHSKGTIVLVSLYEEMNYIYIQFEDNGIGIPAEVAKDVLKPFVRMDESRNSGTGGSGLGLSIAYKIIEAHGGSLELKTDTDQGCKFYITLPQI